MPVIAGHPIALLTVERAKTTSKQDMANPYVEAPEGVASFNDTDNAGCEDGAETR
jgi:hypothetical protein